MYQTEAKVISGKRIYQYRLAISPPAVLKLPCPVTQFPTRWAGEGNSCSPLLCLESPPHIKGVTHSDLLPALNLLPTSHHPGWQCSCWLESPPTSKSRSAVSGTLASRMTRLPEVGCSAGWDLKVTTNLPDLVGCMIQRQEAGLLPLSLKERKG